MLRKALVVLNISVVALLVSFQPSCSNEFEEAFVTLLSNNGTNYDIDFPYVCIGKIGDYVWIDQNRNGIQDEDQSAGLPGVRVVLRNDKDDIVDQNYTDNLGFYLFEDLCSINFKVDVDESTLPSYLNPTVPDISPNDSIDSDGPLDGSPVIVTFPKYTSNNPTIDFGYVCDGMIGDYVWIDENRNGIQDEDEFPGLSGIQIILKNGTTGMELAQDFTDEFGLYLFEGLCPGNYTVNVSDTTLPSYLEPTTPNIGDDDLKDSDGSIGSGSVHVNLSEDNPHNTTIDFGYVCNGTIGDYVWIDKNCNGRQDLGESYDHDFKVNVTLYNASWYPLKEVKIDPNGSYKFEGLCPGEYIVIVNDPPDFDITTPNVGSDDKIDSEECPAFVILTEDDPHNTSIDFGFYLIGSCITEKAG